MVQFAHKKSLGQNFLTNNAIIQHIVDFACVTADDTVIEIGPGQGILTDALAQRAKTVVAIELDDRLLPVLQKRFSHSTNVTLVHGDILKMDISTLIAEQCASSVSYKVVANIPYYITAPIIRLFLEQEYAPHSLTLMVQKEMAERLCAQPGDMSVIAIAAQYYADVEYGFTVLRQDFDPMPAVDSAVVKLTIKDRRPDLAEFTKQFFRVVKIGFSARRKTLVNNLANGLHRNKDDVAALLCEVGFQENVRAQELGVEQWRAVTEHILQKDRGEDDAVY